MTDTHFSTTVPISTQVLSAASRNAASGWDTLMKSACNETLVRFNRPLTRITVYATPTQLCLPGLQLCISCQTADQMFPQWRHQEDVCKSCGPETLLPWEPDAEPSGNRQDRWALTLQTDPENREERHSFYTENKVNASVVICMEACFCQIKKLNKKGNWDFLSPNSVFFSQFWANNFQFRDINSQFCFFFLDL